MLVGYARVSTTDQHLDLQRDALTQAGCDRLFTDTASGTTAQRPGLIAALYSVRAGDVLAVSKLDRLGRSLKNLLEMVTALEHRGIGFKSLQERMDTTTPGGVRTRQVGAVMAITIGRVVTGHDANGNAVVRIDDVSAHVASGRPRMSRQLVWTTDEVPVHCTEDGEDQGAREIGTTMPNGSVFRVIAYAPGVTPRPHRTDSSDDAVVRSGAIDLELGDTVVHLQAGDVLVQRGTMHHGVNRGTAPCVIACVVISADGHAAVG